MLTSVFRDYDDVERIGVECGSRSASDKSPFGPLLCLGQVHHLDIIPWIIWCSPMPSSFPSLQPPYQFPVDSRHTRTDPNSITLFSSNITRRLNHHLPCFLPHPTTLTNLRLWSIVSTHPRHD